MDKGNAFPPEAWRLVASLISTVTSVSRLMFVHINISHREARKPWYNEKVDKGQPVRYEKVNIDGWEIPEGYSTKDWDQHQRPILVLGSVFDANSLGKWIFDWSVFRYGPQAPIVDIAADLWLLLISLMQREHMQRENRERRRSRKCRALAEGIRARMEMQWQELELIIADCEGAMRSAGKRKASGEVLMDREAGVAFVDRMFGRDFQLEATQQLMNEIRYSNARADEQVRAAVEGTEQPGKRMAGGMWRIV